MISQKISQKIKEIEREIEEIRKEVLRKCKYQPRDWHVGCCNPKINRKIKKLKAKLETWKEANEIIEKVIDEVIFKAETSTFYEGIGYWTDERDIEGIKDGLLKLQQELKQKLGVGK